MKIQSIPAALLVLAAVPVYAADTDTTLRFYNRTEFLVQSVSGVGKAQSFYDPGSHLFHETDILATNGLGRSWNSLFNATVRYTDSRQYDPDNLSLQRFQWQISDAQTQINFGDYFAVFSPYAMTKGIKGLAFQRNFSNDQNYVRATYGTFDGQWSYLFKNAANEPMDRFGGGLRLQQAGENWRLGFNLVQAADRFGDPNRRNFDAYRQVLPAVDWEWRREGWLFSGDHAYSDTKISRADGSQQDVSGSANRLAFRSSIRTFNFDGLAERVGSRFVTLGGGATPDRMRFMLRGDWRMSALWRFNGMTDYYYNNLDGQLATRTTVSSLDLGATRRRVFDRKNSSLGVGVKTRGVKSQNDTTDARTDRLKFRFKDRYLDDVLDFSLGLEKTLQDERQGTAPGETASYLYDASFGVRANVSKNWLLRGNLDLGLMENQNPTTGSFDAMDTVRLALTAEGAGGTQFGASIDYGNNRLTIANASSRVDRYMLFWQTQPAWTGGGILRAELADNNYQFDDANKNFRERLLRLVLNWNLDFVPR